MNTKSEVLNEYVTLCIYTPHRVLFFIVLFCLFYFVRVNRLLFAGVCLVGASRAPRASLTRAQQRLNNYSAEYNLFPNF